MSSAILMVSEGALHTNSWTDVLMSIIIIEIKRNEARSAFLEVFMGRTLLDKSKASNKSPPTPFSVLVHKLQDLLSRAEHFEVVTVHQNTFDGNRGSAASMLAKQLRLK